VGEQGACGIPCGWRSGAGQPAARSADRRNPRPPLAKIDPNTLAPLINAALPIILQLLQSRQQGATGAQPGQGIDLAGILGQLMGGLAPQPVTPPPPPAPVVVETKAQPKTSVGLGLLGLFGSAIGMAMARSEPRSAWVQTRPRRARSRS
jgi:hypothetical protein